MKHFGVIERQSWSHIVSFILLPLCRSPWTFGCYFANRLQAVTALIGKAEWRNTWTPMNRDDYEFIVTKIFLYGKVTRNLLQWGAITGLGYFIDLTQVITTQRGSFHFHNYCALMTVLWSTLKHSSGKGLRQISKLQSYDKTKWRSSCPVNTVVEAPSNSQSSQ